MDFKLFYFLHLSNDDWKIQHRVSMNSNCNDVIPIACVATFLLLKATSTDKPFSFIKSTLIDLITTTKPQLLKLNKLQLPCLRMK